MNEENERESWHARDFISVINYKVYTQYYNSWLKMNGKKCAKYFNENK